MPPVGMGGLPPDKSLRFRIFRNEGSEPDFDKVELSHKRAFSNNNQLYQKRTSFARG